MGRAQVTIKTRSSLNIAALLASAAFLCGPVLAQEADAERVIPATIEEVDCGECHEEVEHVSSAHPDFVCIDCHINVPVTHEDDDLEPLTDEQACGECHRRPLRDVGRGIHDGETGCMDCHVEPHSIQLVAELDSAVSAANQVPVCAGCHDDPETIVQGYLDGVHGHGLFHAGLSSSASCSDCHEAHRMSAVDDDRALISHEKTPETCGTCHDLLLADWQDNSAHGLAWQEENTDAAVCTSCHTPHSLVSPSDDLSRLASTDTCGGCHEEYFETYRHSFHGKANRLGFVAAATCADCHTAHTNLAADHPDSSVHPDNLIDTCGTCHEGATASFVQFQSHNNPADPEDDFRVYVVFIFMTVLLLGVFAFFGIHDLLWLQRSLVGAMRGEYKGLHENASGQYVRRFSNANILLHLSIIVTFLLLALTGLPLKFSDAPWARQLIGLLGGVESSTFIHRLAGAGTFAYALYHLGDLFVRFVFKREKGMLWGPNSMVPQPKDIMDILRNVRYFLYLGKRPENDRWNYIEKFDYLAVFWGVLIIGTSGLMLWFPMFFTSFLPGWVINAAYVVHSDEALLATGFIFFFHFFHTHLRPESFPMDTVIFTGKMSLERFREERSQEYERLVANGELEQYLVDPPTAAERRRAYIWGSVFLVTGLLLAVGIVWALLTHW